MSLDVSHAYLCVRDLDAEGCPVLPDTWSCTVEDAGWFTVTRTSDGLRILAWRASQVGSRALFALFGPRSILDAVAAVEPACMPAAEAWARRTEPAIRAWLRYWPVWRIDGHVRDADGVAQPVSTAVVRLVPSGVQIPDPSVTPLPWLLDASGAVVATQAAAVVRVAAIYRPAMDQSMRDQLAGWELAATCEGEPAR